MGREATRVEGGTEDSRRSPPASHAPVDPRGEAAEGSGDEKGRVRPLFLNHGVEVGGKGGSEVNGAEGASGLDQLHQLGVAGEKPLGTKGAKEGRFKCEGGAGGVEVQDRGGAGGERGKGEIGRGEPYGGGRAQGREGETMVEEGGTR